MEYGQYKRLASIVSPYARPRFSPPQKQNICVGERAPLMPALCTTNSDTQGSRNPPRQIIKQRNRIHRHRTQKIRPTRPPSAQIETLDQQVQREYKRYKSQPSALSKNAFLTQLLQQNCVIGFCVRVALSPRRV